MQGTDMGMLQTGTKITITGVSAATIKTILNNKHFYVKKIGAGFGNTFELYDDAAFTQPVDTSTAAGDATDGLFALQGFVSQTVLQIPM